MKVRQGLIEFAVAGLLVLSSPLQAETARQAILTHVQGNVEVRLAGAAWQAAQAGTSLQEKDEVRTGLDGLSEILLDEGRTGKVDLKENSHFRVRSLGIDPASGKKMTVLDFALGKALIRAEKVEEGSTFEVRTPTSTIGVKEALFEVVVEEER